MIESRPLRFFWVRHAPPVNPDGLCYGQSDIPADLKNRQAFKKQSVLLPQKALWFSSPLSRAFATAVKLAAYKSGNPSAIAIHKDPRLMEQSFGEWQKMKTADLARVIEFAAYRTDPVNITPPGGESLAHMKDRVTPCIREMLGNFAGKEDNLVIVCHGGPIRAAISLASGLGMHDTLRFSVDPLSVSIIQYDANRIKHSRNLWTIEAINLRP